MSFYHQFLAIADQKLREWSETLLREFQPKKEMAPSQLSGPSTSTQDQKQEVDLIETVNQLQNILHASGYNLDISLPRIAVIGCQSAGKSSVLERFVGKEFLPRGAKLVTRRPIIVQLTPASEEYGVFLHEEKKFKDFEEIKKEIMRLTELECDPMHFSEKPISLTIYSPRVLKLTVVDLPGIIKIPVAGQKASCVEEVRKIVLDNIKDETTIILAVTPNSQDLSGSDAIEYAKLVDPEGIRTIGVLTKLDIEGCDARDILDNVHLPLKRGWVGVVNRKQDETDAGKDMDYIEKEEKKFFQNSKFYSHMAHRMGIPYLQKMLQKTLRAHIKQYLPKLRTDIASKLSRCQKEIEEFESIVGEGPNAKQLFMIRQIQKFCINITENIMGYSPSIGMDDFTYGAQINVQLQTEVKNIITEVVLFPEEEVITVAIRNVNGMRHSISIPTLAIDSVCRKLIARFKHPVHAAVSCVKETLKEAVEDSASILNTYPSLRNELMYQINLWIEKEGENTVSRLESHIDAEMSFINIAHPDFDSVTCDPVAPPTGPVKICTENDSKDTIKYTEDINIPRILLKKCDLMQKQVQYVTAIVVKYLEIVQKQILDLTVKYIAYFLVQKVLHSINQDLITTVLDSSNSPSVMEDYDEFFRRREEMLLTCKALEKALSAIKSF